jgi:hypothetical protein
VVRAVQELVTIVPIEVVNFIWIVEWSLDETNLAAPAGSGVGGSSRCWRRH